MVGSGRCRNWWARSDVARVPVFPLCVALLQATCLGGDWQRGSAWTVSWLALASS